MLASLVGGDPARPLLTYYDDATGERTELSTATLGNWVVKTANLLLDECGLGPGDRATILLPPHWQSAAVLLGTWTAGLSVDIGDAPEPGASGPVEVTFAGLDRLAGAPEAEHRFVLGLAPMGTPLRQVPAGFRDYIAEVRGQGDRLSPLAPPIGTDPASVDGEGSPWASAPQELAARHGIGAGDRVLVDAAQHRHPGEWLLAPFVAGASVVLCAHLDPDRLDARVASEQVTRVW
jgi:uncharacterized protein (TIGR03089 family)